MALIHLPYSGAPLVLLAGRRLQPWATWLCHPTQPGAINTIDKCNNSQTFSSTIADVLVDDFGTVSSVLRDDLEKQGELPPLYVNRDGYRREDGRYKAFLDSITRFIPRDRQITDPLRTFAYGGDASFYRLVPKAVIKVANEDEMRCILQSAREHLVPVTFRAAGTSLSGQAVTDSVLLKISYVGRSFKKCQIHGDGSRVSVDVGLIGGEVNTKLLAHKLKGSHEQQYKIGPDPASIDSAMIGGIVANNASGMCCGVTFNSYHTIQDMRMVLLDGTILDTADPESCKRFMESHQYLVKGITRLAQATQQDTQLSSRIRQKFKIKNTVGYSLNALVDFPPGDPINIIKHLMVGSEGTLGFISNVTYNTVPEWAHKASAFLLFPSAHAACTAAKALREGTNVDAVEMFDYASLKLCNEEMIKLVPEVARITRDTYALLMECRGKDPDTLTSNIKKVQEVLKGAEVSFGVSPDHPQPLETYPFRDQIKDYKQYWDFRKGIFTAVGGAREPGTQVMIEDVVCPIENLAAMTNDLIDLFRRHGYQDACCYGHVLEGNVHLVFSQGFRTVDEVQRFGSLIHEMAHLVAVKHNGTLKGEHGTGRNMAPFLELQWGAKAVQLIREIKELFDPDYLLNPGVIINDDPYCYTKFLKPSPTVSAIIDRCTECGYCEAVCPSRDITTSPRHRITVAREITRLRELDSRTKEQEDRLATMVKDYEYMGDATCAADGMCKTRCPVYINTGEYIKHKRVADLAEAKGASGIAMWLANNFRIISTGAPMMLRLVDWMHGLVGPRPLELISSKLNKWTGRMVPVWNPYVPKAAQRIPLTPKGPLYSAPLSAGGIPRKVVYFPACVTRMMGPTRGDTLQESVHEKVLSVLQKAGYEVVLPDNLNSLCCGMMFDSRGFKDAALSKRSELETALMKASEMGKLPILCDTSPCLATIKDSPMAAPDLMFSLYEPVTFVDRFLRDKLSFKKVRKSVAVHIPCTSSQMMISQDFVRVAELCAGSVVKTGIPCCGMAGDRGLRYPELTAASCQHLDLPADVHDGYSTARTCEIGVSHAAQRDFRSIMYLVDEATSPLHDVDKATSSSSTKQKWQRGQSG